MKLGFFTACLADVPLEDLAPWASKRGFEALELAAWPADAKEGYSPHHIDCSNLTDFEVERIQNLVTDNGLEISALGFYENMMDADEAKSRRFHNHLRNVIDAASKLGVQSVGTFVGGNAGLSPSENILVIGSLFRNFVNYASDRGVRLMIENCPMLHWQRFNLPGNFAFSPELWDALFSEVDKPNFGLNLDPSHLYWLGIDHLVVVRDYADRIFHTHAKDTEMIASGRYRYGVLARQLTDNPWVSGWWRYRMPGRGEIDWHEFVGALTSVGYQGALSIEHEDPDFEGSVDRVKEGLRLGLDYLQSARSAVAQSVDQV